MGRHLRRDLIAESFEPLETVEITAGEQSCGTFSGPDGVADLKARAWGSCIEPRGDAEAQRILDLTGAGCSGRQAITSASGRRLQRVLPQFDRKRREIAGRDTSTIAVSWGKRSSSLRWKPIGPEGVRAKQFCGR